MKIKTLMMLISTSFIIATGSTTADDLNQPTGMIISGSIGRSMEAIKKDFLSKLTSNLMTDG